MKKFLAVYTGSETSKKKWEQLDTSARKEREQTGMKAWQAWVEKHEDAIVDHGAPLGKTKLINAKGVSDIRNEMAAFTVVEAESHDAAARMFVEHPHFTIFPGEGVEVMECLPIPS
jgi:hypothetical protein